MAPTLVAVTLLATMPSDVMAAASDPTCIDDVAANRRAAHMRDAALSFMPLDYTHTVVSEVLPPNRDAVDVGQAP